MKISPELRRMNIPVPSEPVIINDSPRIQCLTLMLFALDELNFQDRVEAPRRKDEIYDFIATRRWYDFNEEDLQPTQVGDQKHEQLRWKLTMQLYERTATSWKLVVERDDGSWELTPAGEEWIEGVRGQCYWRRSTVQMCYLWSREFKKFVAPHYVPSAEDYVRPEDFYQGV